MLSGFMTLMTNSLCVKISVYYLKSAVEEAAVLSWLIAEPFAWSDGGHGPWGKDALQPTAA